MCNYPINIKNPYYVAGSDNGEYKRILVPCNKCVSCIKRRTNQWWVRLRYEMKYAESAHFVSLDYAIAPRSYNDLLTVSKRDVQLFLKRLRKIEKDNKKIKYYAVSEYGKKGTHRPHYHIIFFNVLNSMNFLKAWEYKGTPIGRVDIGDVTDASIRYVTGYIGKKSGIGKLDYDDRTPEFSLMSKGLGYKYFKDHLAEYYSQKELGYVDLNGQKYPMPRYLKNKIYDEYKRRKIGRTNYDRFIKNQEKQIADFPSFQHWDHNRIHVAEINNKHKSTINNFKI